MLSKNYNRSDIYPFFKFQKGILYVENIPLDFLAKKFGTPLYVYSRAALHFLWKNYEDDSNLKHSMICYAIKANSNIAIIKEFSKLGAGFDIVSGGELQKILSIHGDTQKVVFSGTGKQIWEMRDALQANIKLFNIESESELYKLSYVASSLGLIARVAIRINPNVNTNTHYYISTGTMENKFGIPITHAIQVYKIAVNLPNIQVIGIGFHIGSQLTSIEPYFSALQKVLHVIKILEKHSISIQYLNIGGGIGIRYFEEKVLNTKSFIHSVFKKLHDQGMDHIDLILEPGRSLIGHAGILLTTVQYIKNQLNHNFVVVDVAMNDFLRPPLYHAYHRICPVVPKNNEPFIYDLVGPICESGDWIAKHRTHFLQTGDVIAIESVGAYGMAMSSNYNSRPRAAEVIVDKQNVFLIRKRESLEDLIKNEYTI